MYNIYERKWKIMLENPNTREVTSNIIGLCPYCKRYVYDYEDLVEGQATYHQECVLEWVQDNLDKVVEKMEEVK